VFIFVHLHIPFVWCFYTDTRYVQCGALSSYKLLAPLFYVMPCHVSSLCIVVFHMWCIREDMRGIFVLFCVCGHCLNSYFYLVLLVPIVYPVFSTTLHSLYLYWKSAQYTLHSMPKGHSIQFWMIGFCIGPMACFWYARILGVLRSPYKCAI